MWAVSPRRLDSGLRRNDGINAGMTVESTGMTVESAGMSVENVGMTVEWQPRISAGAGMAAKGQQGLTVGLPIRPGAALALANVGKGVARRR